MRDGPAGRMLGLTGIMLAGLIALNGCNSTPTLPATLAAKSDKQPAARKDAKDAPSEADPRSEIAWKAAVPAPSTATPQDYWANPKSAGDSVRATGFQAPPLAKDDAPAIPELMPDTPRPPREVPAQTASFLKQPASHLGTPPPSITPQHAPNEMSRVQLEYRINPPDVLWIEAIKALVDQKIDGPHTVRPDGTVSIGVHGSPQVANKTIAEAREEIARSIYSRMDPKGPTKYKDVLDGLSVDVVAYNSSVYYVIVDGAGLGEQVHRLPVTGHETVLDAISLTGGLQFYSSPRRIWVARRNAGGTSPDSILPVDWRAITKCGEMNTNWQVMPGDRIYVQADPYRTFSNKLAKYLEPVKELLGVTLLGSQTVNSIKSGAVVGGVGR